METVILQINNNKAYKLLEDLEDLHIIKGLKKAYNRNKDFLKNMPANCLLILQMNFRIM